jgi:hypothetical protein
MNKRGALARPLADSLIASEGNNSGSQESEFRIQNKIRKNRKNATDIPPRPCV